MEDVTFSEGKLHAGSSWFRLSMINEVTIERGSAIGSALLYLALLSWYAPIFFRQTGGSIGFWVSLAIVFGLFCLRVAKQRILRVFVCMDSGRIEVAKIRGDDFLFSRVKIREAEKRARLLAEEIRSNIPDRA
jgi:hypothetical protein